MFKTIDALAPRPVCLIKHVCYLSYCQTMHWSSYHLLLLLFENFGNALIMFTIEGALPIEKGNNDSWYICIAQCNVCCLFLDVGCDFKHSGTKPNQVLFKILFFLQKQKAPECKIGSSAGFTWLVPHTEVVPTMQQSKNSKFQKRIEITVKNNRTTAQLTLKQMWYYVLHLQD